MKKILFLSYFGFKLKNFLSDCFLISHVHIYGWEDSWRARQAQSDHWRLSQGPQNSPKIYISFTFWPINEKLVFKLFPLVVHMSPLWWGLHLLTFWCPWYPWILCRGPTWPRKKWNLFYFFHFFFILTQKVLIRLLLYLTCKLLLNRGYICEPRWAQSDYSSTPPPPPGPHIAKDVNICTYM